MTHKLLILKAKASAPRCVVDFYSLAGAFRTEAVIQPRSGLLSSAARDPRRFLKSPSSGILSCQTSKDIGLPAGMFTIQLADRPLEPANVLHNLPVRRGGGNIGRRWRDVLGKNDLAIIRMQRPPGPMEVVMVGLLDRKPGWGTQATPSGVERTVAITGQDLGGLLINTKLWYSGQAPGNDPVLATYGGKLLFPPEFIVPAGSRAKRAQIVLDTVLYAYCKQIFPNYLGDEAQPVTAKGLLGYLLGKGELIAYDESFFNEDGPVWNLVREMCDEPWYELFVDTFRNEYREDYMPDGLELRSYPATLDIEGLFGTYLVMRKTPWDKDQWEKLPIVAFGDSVVKSEQVGGTSEVYNFFYARPRETSYQIVGSLPQSIAAWIGPKQDPDLELSVGHHGLGLMIKDFVGWVESDTIESLYKIVKTRSERLHRWFKYAHEMYSGHFTIQGNPAPRIGCRLRRLDSDNRLWEFYIENVGHNFVAFQSYDTTLQVTRGREIRQHTGFEGSADVAAETAPALWDLGRGNIG